MLETAPTHRDIAASYRGEALVHLYARIRLWILRRSFLPEVARHLPRDGRVLDVGCGFGMAALVFAAGAPDRRIFGFDLSARRIATARRSAGRLVDRI
jgi:methylase of polypeptide subunit release factors